MTVTMAIFFCIFILIFYEVTVKLGGDEEHNRGFEVAVTKTKVAVWLNIGVHYSIARLSK